MIFEKGHLYHIYNQGNNHDKLYYNRQDYLLFMKKIRKYIIPYADILAWCLMPNHFHLMVQIISTEITIKHKESTDCKNSKKRTLNSSIAIMLRSYTRIIDQEQERVGSLFRQKTKAVCLDPADGFAPVWYKLSGLTKLNYQFPEFRYPQICFNYIHNNPVDSRLVKDISSWEFSSAPEILGLVKSRIANKQKILELGLKLSIENEPAL